MKKSISNDEYRKALGVANSDLLLVATNPANYVWSKEAPSDPLKSSTADFGTALHTALLEPELFNDQVLVADVKGRTTAAFAKTVMENPSKLVLTESEATQIKLMQASAMAHPEFAACINAEGDCESSLFAQDPVRKIMLKIRPDKDSHKLGFLSDVKTTADISDWRSNVTWKNPLFKYNYGHQAAYYLKVASLFHDRSITEFRFLVLQKTASFGRYPATVFSITLSELDQLGFVEDVEANLDTFANCHKTGNWSGVETFTNLLLEDIEIGVAD